MTRTLLAGGISAGTLSRRRDRLAEALARLDAEIAASGRIVGGRAWAKKLMPGHPDPRVNLALTLEKAGRTKDAMDAYGSALEVYPGHLAGMEGLARLQLASGKTDDKTKGYLDEIALRGETDEWRQWAKVQRARMER